MLITDQVATAPCTDRVQLCFGLLRQSQRSSSMRLGVTKRFTRFLVRFVPSFEAPPLRDPGDPKARPTLTPSFSHELDSAVSFPENVDLSQIVVHNPHQI